jgi:transposase
MPGPQPASVVHLTKRVRKLLKQSLRRQQLPRCLEWRIRIVLQAAKGRSNSRIARRLGLDRGTVRLWRARWADAQAQFETAVLEGATRRQLSSLIERVLADAPRPGAPDTFTPEQRVAMIAVSCEPPSLSGRPVSHWTPRELAAEVIKRGLVPNISARTIGRLWDEAHLKPHLSRYWLNSRPEEPTAFDAQVRLVCDLYQQAAALQRRGVHLVSTDEKTGIQALERIAPTLPMQPDRVERLEFEYIRHGTQCLIANFEIATGHIVTPTIGLTRTEADFVTHIAQTVATDPTGEWVFIVDQLNIHQSEGLVRWVAAADQLEVELGEKGHSGVLASMSTRKAFLEDAKHRIRFVYTPKHTSWLNQVELWFSILVRRLLKRASFTSTADLRQRLLDFIAYFNQHLAHPFKWTYTGKPLTV